MAISTHYIYRDRHDTNFKNSRFTEADKHNEEYLGVLDGSRTIAPRKIAPNPKTNPNPSPNPDQGTIFLGGNYVVALQR